MIITLESKLFEKTKACFYSKQKTAACFEVIAFAIFSMIRTCHVICQPICSKVICYIKGNGTKYLSVYIGYSTNFFAVQAQKICTEIAITKVVAQAFFFI